MAQTFKNIKIPTTTLSEVLTDYSKLDYLFHFISLNPTAEILGSLHVGNIIIDDFVIENIETAIIIKPKSIVIKDTFKSNQTLFDVLTRYHGDISEALNFIVDNGFENINQDLTSLPFTILVPNNNNSSVMFYNKNNSHLATGTKLITINAVSPTAGRSFSKSFSFSFH
jgi:hypothetical protein